MQRQARRPTAKATHKTHWDAIIAVSCQLCLCVMQHSSFSLLLSLSFFLLLSRFPSTSLSPSLSVCGCKCVKCNSSNDSNCVDRRGKGKMEMGHTRCQRLLKSSLYLDKAATSCTETPPGTCLPALYTLRLPGLQINLTWVFLTRCQLSALLSVPHCAAIVNRVNLSAKS